MLLMAVGCGQAPDHPGAADGGPVPSDPTGLQLEPSSEVEACTGLEVEAEPLPVDLFAMVDASSSMLEATSTGVSKWYATKAAFHDFLEHAPAGMGLGLSLFPLPSDDSASCSAQRYRDSALPIADVSQMMQGVLAWLDAVTPRGQTPTAPALAAAYEMAGAHAVAHPERSVVVVLATDGLPTTCDPVDVAALSKLAKGALRGPGRLRTLVVVSRNLQGADQSGFRAIAAAGGTGRALSLDPQGDFAGQLSSALGAAAAQKVACDLALPEPPDHARLDYDAVNVVLDAEAGRTTFPRVDSPSECGAQGGWYYDLKPEEGAPSRLQMCQASCDRLSDTGSAKLRVELGCKTVVH
jgi:hypothetical protein